MTTCFPLRHRPFQTYHTPPRCFGAVRDHGARKHAGCDLYAPAGTEVLACIAGAVIRGPYPFYDVVYALEIKHADGSVIRYGEIQKNSPVMAGDRVEAGQVIGHVGQMISVPQAMLHFELYDGSDKASGQLTDKSHAPYMRRRDLVDPTGFLDSLFLYAPQPGPTGATT